MAGPDLNRLFAHAEAAFQRGELTAARATLTQVARLAGQHPAVLHLTALVDKGLGDHEAALRGFRAAARLAPRDAQIANNLGNLLDDMERPEEALAAYDAAIGIDPRSPAFRLNRAIALHRVGRLDPAREDFLAALSADPGSARGWAGWAALERDAGDLDSAAMGFDRALALAPGHATALHGRARVAMERGESQASPLYRASLAQVPDDPERILGLAETLDAEGDPAGITMLAAAVAERPGWTAGHEMLARMRAEAGDPEDCTRSYAAALRTRPDDAALNASHWASLGRAGRHGDALAALNAARATLGESRNLLLTEAALAAEAGEAARAAAVLARLDDGVDVLLVRGREALRTGRADAAAALLERATAAEPDLVSTWAHLDLAWRLTGDDRHAWLSGQQGLYAARDIGLSAAELTALAALLRSLHRARAQPLGQSLRGGTQTRGRLLARIEPEIARLAEALRAAVDAHVAGLPAADPRHPLLRHRDRPFAFAGSWSVRLTASGFHVNHIHPEGALSSACYIALPATLGGDARNGWLELGAAPVELGLPLGPIATIEPQPGRLALFPSTLYHGTRPFADGERLTVAFDLKPA